MYLWQQTLLSAPYLDIHGTDLEMRLAAQALIRPLEVAHLVTFGAPGPRSRNPFPIQVANFLAERLTWGGLNYIAERPHPYDRWQSPRMTLRRSGGDCEDLAILGVSMLRRGGVRAWLAVGALWQGGAPGGHAWIEGLWGDEFFLIEATSGQLFTSRPRGYALEAWLG